MNETKRRHKIEEYKMNDCKRIQEAFKQFGGTHIGINKAYSLWKNHSEGYCASWENGVDSFTLEDLYEMLNFEWASDSFYSLLNRL